MISGAVNTSPLCRRANMLRVISGSGGPSASPWPTPASDSSARGVPAAEADGDLANRLNGVSLLGADSFPSGKDRRGLSLATPLVSSFPASDADLLGFLDMDA